MDLLSYVLPDELYLGLVLSTCALGEVVHVDWQAALACPGVVDKVDHTDVPGKNMIGVQIQDEEVFATKSVSSQPTGYIVLHCLSCVLFNFLACIACIAYFHSCM